MNDLQLDNLVRQAFSSEAPSDALSHRLREPATPRRRFRLMPVAVAVGALCAIGAGIVTQLPRVSRFHFPAYGDLEIVGSSGTIYIYSPDGKLLGWNKSQTPGGEAVQVGFDGHRQTMRGLGSHAVLDSSGRVRLVLEFDNPGPNVPQPHSVSEMLQAREKELRSQGTFATGGIPWMAIGFFPNKSVLWRVEGPAFVAVEYNGSHQSAQAGWDAPGSLKAHGVEEDIQPRKTPLLTWQVDGQTYQRPGYGTFQVKDSKGAVIGTIEVAPPKQMPASDGTMSVGGK